MTESTLMLLLIGKLLLVSAFAWLYALGGRSDKVWRRFVGGVLFPLGVCGIAYLSHSFSVLMLLACLSYPFALSQGYGGDSLAEKFKRRSLYGVLLGLASLPFFLVTGNWILGVLQIFLAVICSLVLGIVNPTNAVDEEALIASGSVLLVPFMV